MNLTDYLLAHEASIRLGFFFSLFFIMALWEWRRPARPRLVSRSIRWLNNIGLVFLNTLILRLLFPLAAVGMASFVEANQWGLLNYYAVPTGWAIVIAIVCLDFAIYMQHVMFHAVPSLWRLHRVHHADLDYDMTTGARFHSLEIVFSMLIKFAVIAVLGASAAAVIMFEVILSSMAMFNHGNVRLPLGLDRWLRLLVVTPDMHRVHHSIIVNETNSNFGFNISLWDRLFGTYQAQPAKGHQGMEIGIKNIREAKTAVWLPGMLALPFTHKVSGYAINYRGRDDKTASK